MGWALTTGRDFESGPSMLFKTTFLFPQIELPEAVSKVSNFFFLFPFSALLSFGGPPVCPRVARWYIHFHTKNPNLGIFWRAVEWKMFAYFTDCW
jgi:hypothetical protein